MHPYPGRKCLRHKLLQSHPSGERAGRSFESQPVYQSHAEHSLLFRYTRNGDCLFNPLAAALNQNGQHDYRKDSGNDPNNGYIVHVNLPSY